jgi:hypothetical protein
MMTEAVAHDEERTLAALIRYALRVYLDQRRAGD